MTIRRSKIHPNLMLIHRRLNHLLSRNYPIMNLRLKTLHLSNRQNLMLILQNLLRLSFQYEFLL
jgi:hypothetical protein